MSLVSLWETHECPLMPSVRHRLSYSGIFDALNVFHCLQFPSFSKASAYLCLLHNPVEVFWPLTYIRLCYVMSIVLSCGLPSFCLKDKVLFWKNILVNGFSFNECEWQLRSISTMPSQSIIKYDPSKLCIH